MSRPSRRTFVKGLAAGSVVASVGLWRDTAWAQGAPRRPTSELPGTDFDLGFTEMLVNFTGSPRIAHTVNGSLPAPILRWKEGDTVTMRVANRLRDGSGVDSLARHSVARQHGRGPRAQLQRDCAG